MDSFHYTDIFATKGAEYLIVIAFLLLLIPLWRLLNQPVGSRQPARSVQRTSGGGQLRIPPGLLLHPNHTWSHLEPDGLARVGLTHLLLSLTGGVEVHYLKQHLESVEKGEPLLRLSAEGKSLDIRSPLSGLVGAVHSPRRSLHTADAYAESLLTIEPARWQSEIRDARLGESGRHWAGSEMGRFRDFLMEEERNTHPVPGPMLQEGGEIANHPLRDMDQGGWDRFSKEFLEPHPGREKSFS
ncbi:MAG: hypothetical protein R2751_08800 [Bacteroidales bacterium]